MHICASWNKKRERDPGVARQGGWILIAKHVVDRNKAGPDWRDGYPLHFLVISRKHCVECRVAHASCDSVLSSSLLAYDDDLFSQSRVFCAS